MQILFDNCKISESCLSLWGFSAYFQEFNFLFDTGSNGRVLLQNMKKKDIDVEEIEYLFITHAHWDHIGGIDSIIELNPQITLFVPFSLSKHLIRDLTSLVKEVVVCQEEPMHLVENLYTTGVIGSDILEQSLIIDGDSPEVITGCGHFGIENITQRAKNFLKKDILSVAGGFHLLYSDEKKILQTIKRLKEMGVKYAKPTHCSGDLAIKLFAENFLEEEMPK